MGASQTPVSAQQKGYYSAPKSKRHRRQYTGRRGGVGVCAIIVHYEAALPPELGTGTSVT